jgi:hypothetical protein
VAQINGAGAQSLAEIKPVEKLSLFSLSLILLNSQCELIFEPPLHALEFVMVSFFGTKSTKLVGS